MLRGNYPATVDGKGRLKIPTTFKAYLDENYGPDLYVTSLDGQSVRIYPFSVWREIEEKLAALPSMNKSKRSEEHTSELQSRSDLVCRLLLEKKKNNQLPR